MRRPLLRWIYPLLPMMLGISAQAAPPSEPTCGQFNAAKQLDALNQPSKLALYSAQVYVGWKQLDERAVALGHAPVVTNSATMQAGVEALLTLCTTDPAQPLSEAGKIAWGSVALAIAHLQDEQNGDLPPDPDSP